MHGARISGLEARMTIVEDRLCDLDARGSEEADNLANERELDRFIITGNLFCLILFIKAKAFFAFTLFSNLRYLLSFAVCHIETNDVQQLMYLA